MSISQLNPSLIESKSAEYLTEIKEKTNEINQKEKEYKAKIEKIEQKAMRAADNYEKMEIQYVINLYTYSLKTLLLGTQPS